jgi:hypothetical protein
MYGSKCVTYIYVTQDKVINIDVFGIEIRAITIDLPHTSISYYKNNNDLNSLSVDKTNNIYHIKANLTPMKIDLSHRDLYRSLYRLLY